MSVVAFAQPWGLALGAAAAAALVALHAITVGRPRPRLLPTARFAPERAPRAARQLRRPRDLALLALRALAALAAGAALAGPVRVPERQTTRRVILADGSRAADTPAARAAVRAGVLAAARPGDVLIAFADRPGAPVTLARGAAADGAPDTAAVGRQLDAALQALGDGRRRAGALSAALVAARRAAPALAAGADSLELVFVSPLHAEEVDAATARVRAAWSGRARVLRVEAEAPPPSATAPGRAAVTLRGAPPDDALAAALALDGRFADAATPAAGPAVRVVRAGGLTDGDRAWAAAARGRVLVDWPADGVPAGARALAAPDTAHALAAVEPGVAGPAAAVAPFARRAAFPEPAAASTPARERVVARWADGRPAAVEVAADAAGGAEGGCVRRVAVAVPQSGDAALRAGFRAVLGALLAPCGRPRGATPLGDAAVGALAGRGPLLAGAPLRAALAPPRPDRLGAALLGAALLALAGELLVRRASARRADAAGEGASSDALAPDRGETDTGPAAATPGGARARAA